MRMIDKNYIKSWSLMWLCATFTQIRMFKASDLDSSSFIHRPDFDGYLHKTYTLTTLFRVLSKIMCASICLQNQECGSFFYVDTPDRLCQLHSVLFLTTNESTPTVGATYYQITDSEYVVLICLSLLLLIYVVYKYLEQLEPPNPAPAV